MGLSAPGGQGWLISWEVLLPSPPPGPHAALDLGQQVVRPVVNEGLWRGWLLQPCWGPWETGHDSQP